MICNRFAVSRTHPILGHAKIQSSGETPPEKSQQVLICKDTMAKSALGLNFVLVNRTSGTIVFLDKTERKTEWECAHTRNRILYHCLT
jgi:hypothetical protein